MAPRRSNPEDYTRPLRRLLVGLLVLACLGLFLVWRADSPRVERLRAHVVDQVVPRLDWAMAPVTGMVNLARDFRSYQRIHEQNLELRRELRQMTVWREAALRLEQENAKLRALNNVSLDPALTFITGTVMADSGSPFRQSVLLNVGSRDGIIDGWPTMDGLGLVGRIAGVGERTSRVILLTDTSSRIPVAIEPSRQRAILTGDNSAYPLLDFVENRDRVRPGDRVVTAGDGGLFPAGLLVGRVAQGTDGRLRLRLAADYEQLHFVRVLRSPHVEAIRDPGGLIVPQGGPPPAEGSDGPIGPPPPPADSLAATVTPPSRPQGAGE
ncbi:rod shape-determining protein MreC [Rubellimicrobium sp. CFH 75288]|uniref:rod shape-determining protein MreC n=1 Tax=Rubellimicrobium sp. CFH 75288 TaxID=2697034 RepID=UPI001411C134|nr:rod shape-determining protein MreC [Rubellimicrobium sp. CFH 75288]NAZ37083.1 rod shape-determining protein MreC [Rubellimicrobium sp. CFH 75288]